MDCRDGGGARSADPVGGGVRPGGARKFHEGDALRDWIELDWGREVPTLLVGAEWDSQLPLEGMEELFERIRSPKQMLIVPGADHHHFCDDAARIHEAFRDVLRSARATPGATQFLARMRPARELCDEEGALTAVRAATLAHFDASLRSVEPANRW
jgi:predicted dienelactone hydrolase